MGNNYSHAIEMPELKQQIKKMQERIDELEKENAQLRKQLQDNKDSHAQFIKRINGPKEIY